jgi:hypothetical protein
MDGACSTPRYEFQILWPMSALSPRAFPVGTEVDEVAMR